MGGALIYGRKCSKEVELNNKSWLWVGPIDIVPNKGVLVEGKCLDGPTTELITFTLMLSPKDKIAISNTINIVGEAKTFDLAWEAEFFPTETLIPQNPGKYMLGIRATSVEYCSIRLKLMWSLTSVMRVPHPSGTPDEEKTNEEKNERRKGVRTKKRCQDCSVENVSYSIPVGIVSCFVTLHPRAMNYAGRGGSWPVVK